LRKRRNGRSVLKAEGDTVPVRITRELDKKHEVWTRYCSWIPSSPFASQARLTEPSIIIPTFPSRIMRRPAGCAFSNE
ncbi:hypothetical protein GT037_010900, partial [Alternaria burnsii]